MSAEDTTNLANGDTGGAAGGSEVETAGATQVAATVQTEIKTEQTSTDSLLAEKPEGEAEKAAKAEDGNAAEDEKKEGEEDGKEKEAEEITPESYGDFEIPDGMPVNQPLLDEFKQFAASNKMSKETAQAIISLKVKEVQEQQAAFQEQRKEWVVKLKTDPDFGGKAFESNVNTASLALRQFDQDGAALNVLQASGLDNHPAIVKLLHRVGLGVADDKVHTPHDRGGKPEKPPLSERLYGKDGMGPKE